MKRIILVVIMFWNLLFGNAAQPGDWSARTRYAQANRELLASNAPVKIVIMGNSITEYWEELHPAFFKANELVCRGISGQVSSQMLARFRQDVINLNPRVVIINCGTNDIAENNGPYDEDITMDNIMSMSELALVSGIQVVLSSVLPCDGFCWNTGVEDVVGKIQRLNRRISDYCRDRQIPYLDHYPSMTVDGAAMTPAFTDDGVHPNSAGYDVMERNLLQLLSTLNL